jgi:uncharacterized protein YprB with RNaseH-like and TPR domain
MDLREKLDYYYPKSVKEIKDEAHDSPVNQLAEELAGILIGSAPLQVIKIVKTYPVEEIIYYSHLQEINCFHLPLLSRGEFPRAIELKNLLFFDLETTGLAGGTGTYPFLLAFAFFEEKQLKVNQYFLPDYGKELEGFLDLQKNLANKSILVSYNGKSFDYPLLRNRFILNRIDDPFHSYQHLDLLHFARRLWKNKLTSCALVNIEQEIFGYQRWQDIESPLIPYVYFEFLRDGKLADIKRVISHNLQDVLSLIRLLYHIHFLENNIPETNELHVLGKFAVENNDLTRLEMIFEKMEKINIAPSQNLLASYSLLLKRTGEWQKAVQLWEDLLKSGGWTIFACEELAKYYEHKKRDYPQAKNYTEKVLHYLDMLEELASNNRTVEIRKRFQIRLKRIIYKLQQPSIQD